MVSPVGDRYRIAFAISRYGDHKIFVMDIDGINVIGTSQKGTSPNWR